MTDSLARTLRKFGDPALVERVLPQVTTQDFDELRQGAMFMTEQGAGSDVSATTTRAEPPGAGRGRRTGHKWFCSHHDAGFSRVLSRSKPADGPTGIPRFL